MPLERHPLFAEAFGQLFHQIHRAVLAAGAADSHGHIAAVVAGEGVQPAFQKMGDVVLHQLHRLLGFQEVDHRLVAPGQVLEFGVVMRVGQHAHVEHVVRIGGHAALERKGLKHQRQLPAGGGNHGLHVALQLRGADDAAVDHMRLLPQVGQQFALQLNGVY